MFFASDNAGPVPQQVLDQMVSANSGYLPSYGADPQMEQVTRLVRENLKHLMPQYIWLELERRECIALSLVSTMGNSFLFTRVAHSRG